MNYLRAWAGRARTVCPPISVRYSETFVPAANGCNWLVRHLRRPDLNVWIRGIAALIITRYTNLREFVCNGLCNVILNNRIVP